MSNQKHIVMNFRVESYDRATVVKNLLRDAGIPCEIRSIDRDGLHTVTTNTRALEIAPELNKVLYSLSKPDPSPLQALANRVREDDEEMNRAERVPTGDDYNELYIAVMQAAQQEPQRIPTPITMQAELLARFPWLGGDDEVSGADVIDALSTWYAEVSK